jgi:hypothetical protein
LKGHSCPGENVCSTDKFRGEIAGIHGKSQGRTFENYCHKEIPTKENGLKPGCPLFDTKPENTPPSLLGAIEAAETLRRYKTRGSLQPITELSAWEWCCFDTAEEVSDMLESEANIEALNDSKDGTSTTGKQTAMGELGKGKEGGAFSDW